MTLSSSSRAFLKCTHVPSNKTDYIHLEDEANRRLTVSEVDVAVRNNLLKVYLSKDKYRALAAYIDSLHLRKVCLWTILVYAFATVAETSICITSSMTLQDKMNYLKLIMTLFNVLEQYKVSYCAGNGEGVSEWLLEALLPSNAEYLKYCNKLAKLKETAEDSDEEGIDITHTDNEDDSDSSDEDSDKDSDSSDKDSDKDSDSSDEDSDKDSDEEEEEAEHEISLLPVNSSVEHQDEKNEKGKKQKTPEGDQESSSDDSSESEEEAISIEPVTLGKRRRG